MKLKVLTSKDAPNKDYEGDGFEKLVNEFCEGKHIISVQFEFSPSISVRHLAYIMYDE